MITISSIKKGILPKNSKAAQVLSAPNYDEFQSDLEVFNIIKEERGKILTVTMPHCDVQNESEIFEDGSQRALTKAYENSRELFSGEFFDPQEDFICVYEINDPRRSDVRQVGLTCMAKTSEIRTDKTPNGTIIRNEGIKEYKAKGRADLISRTGYFLESVNLAVEDTEQNIEKALLSYADSRDFDFSATDEDNNTHKIWVVKESDVKDRFTDLFKKEPCAYVADGNHRSAAAAMLNYDSFLTVLFPLKTMGLAPYNRLVKGVEASHDEILEKLKQDFEIEAQEPNTILQPDETKKISLYFAGKGYTLLPKRGLYDADNAVESIDADIVHKKIFDKVLGIEDVTDERLTFVGGNKDHNYLRQKVDSKEFDFAVLLAPVGLQEFANVCRQNGKMPAKSTWFTPKIRSGLWLAKA